MSGYRQALRASRRMAEAKALFPSGCAVEVWPGVLSGRSAKTTTRGEVCMMGGTLGVYVHSSTDADGKPVSGGFYQMSHVKPDTEVNS